MARCDRWCRDVVGLADLPDGVIGDAYVVAATEERDTAV